MIDLRKLMEANPPRIVVVYKRLDDGKEAFEWGVVGSIPILSLIGEIADIQQDILSGRPLEDCDDSVLVGIWDPVDRKMEWVVNHEIPSYALVGMLETIKQALVMSRMGQHAQAQKVQLLGPDGQPARIH